MRNLLGSVVYLSYSPTISRQPGCSTLPVSGYTTFDATLQDVCTPIKAIVVTNLHKNLLISWQDLIAVRVINKKNPAKLSQQARSVTQDNFESLKANIITRYQETLSDDLNPESMEIPVKAMHIYLCKVPRLIHRTSEENEM